MVHLIKNIVLVFSMKADNKPTTLTLSEKTKEQLAELGKKGETFDTILQRVISNSARLCGKNKMKDSVEESDQESKENPMEESKEE